VQVLQSKKLSCRQTPLHFSALRKSWASVEVASAVVSSLACTRSWIRSAASAPAQFPSFETLREAAAEAASPHSSAHPACCMRRSADSTASSQANSGYLCRAGSSELRGAPEALIPQTLK
jgi:hypothetical protein